MTGKKIAIIIIIIAVGAGAVLAFLFFGKKSNKTEGDAVYVQSVGSLTAANTSAERYSGIVETQKTASTSFDPERKLDQLFVAVGDIVKEGDDLFSYDTESIRLEIEQMKLEIDKLNMDISNSTEEINALNASLEHAESQDKPEYLASIKQLQADIAQAQYDIKSKESEITRQEAAITESVVKANMDGIVESIANAQDIIDGKNYSDDGSTNDTFIVIRAEGDYRVKGKADETSIGRLSRDMDVIVRSRIDDKTWTGKVALIDTQSTAEDTESESSYMDEAGDSASRYNFYVELDSTEGILLGQHVIIEPDHGQNEAKTGIWLSSGFLVEEDGAFYIWASKNESSPLEKRAVTTGTYDEDLDEYEITSGLTMTDYIAWPDDSCREGAPVTSEYTISDEELDDEEYDLDNDMSYSDETDLEDSPDTAGSGVYDEIDTVNDSEW